MNIIIDAEFRALIPPLSSTERDQLKDSVIEQGCLDSLKVWSGSNILLDGHNRFDICTEFDIPYDTLEIELPDRYAATNWIIDNQLSRRNLTPEQTSYLRGKRYQAERADQYSHPKTVDQNDPRSTAQVLADEYKVSAPTIKRDSQFAQAVDTLAEVVGEEVRQVILSGDTSITKKEVTQAAEQAEENPEGAKEWFLNKKKMDVHYSSATDEWHTPTGLLRRWK